MDCGISFAINPDASPATPASPRDHPPRALGLQQHSVHFLDLLVGVIELLGEMRHLRLQLGDALSQEFVVGHDYLVIIWLQHHQQRGRRDVAGGASLGSSSSSTGSRGAAGAALPIIAGLAGSNALDLAPFDLRTTQLAAPHYPPNFIAQGDQRPLQLVAELSPPVTPQSGANRSRPRSRS
jgi:hypothetical protein